MPKTIFHFRGETRDRRLEVNDDGTVAYYVENHAWEFLKMEPKSSVEVVSASEAIARWKMCADAIRDSLKEFGLKVASSS